MPNQLRDKFQRRILAINRIQLAIHLTAIVCAYSITPNPAATWFMTALAPWIFGNLVSFVVGVAKGSRELLFAAFLLTQANGFVFLLFMAWGQVGALQVILPVFLFTMAVTWGITLAVMYQHSREFMDPQTHANAADPPFSKVVETRTSVQGKSLAELSADQRLLILFLRHQGCTFCREALLELRRDKEKLEGQGFALAVVHMADPKQGEQLMTHYDLADVHHFSDPSCQIYRAFELQRGRLMQILSPRIIWRGLKVAIFQRLGFGRIIGDAFQLAGAFVLHRGDIVRHYRTQLASQQADLCELTR